MMGSGSERCGLECGSCGVLGEAESGASAAFFWCRDCGRTLCGGCNARGGHASSHRSATWTDWDVLKSAALAFEARCARRSRLADRETKAVGDFAREVQSRLEARVARDLERRNEADRRRIRAILAAMGDEDGATSNALLSAPAGGPPALDRTLNDADLARISAEAVKVQPSLQPALFAEPLNASPIADPKAASFSALPHNLTPRAFLNFLEEQMRRDARTTEEVEASFRAHDFSTSTPLEEEDPRRPRTQFSFPLEPVVNISNGTSGRDETPERQSSSNISETDGGQAQSSSRSGYFEDGPTARLSESHPALSLPTNNGSAQITRLGSAGSVSSRTPTPSLEGSVDSFHFGQDFLSRPIDVAVLPADRLAVSDSYGGVYITTRGGHLLQKLSGLDGTSASSLAFSRSDNLLYVSLLNASSGHRSIQAFDCGSFLAKEEYAAPERPAVDGTRSRWVATGQASPDLFLASGDGKRSVLWKLEPLSKTWKVVKEARGPSRYQYLQVAEENLEKRYHVVMTTDGLSGAVLLFVVDRTGHLWSEYDLCETHALRPTITAPAAAVVDSASNVLIVDYNSGRLWLVGKGVGEGGGRLRLLAELGAKAALGVSVSQGWAFLACLSRRRVQAIHYRDWDPSLKTSSNASLAQNESSA